MALLTKHNEIPFGVGDSVRVTQRIKEGERERNQAFEGIVIGIKGKNENKTFIVRRIGAQQIGIERIFPLDAPTIEKVEVIRKGTPGVRHAKIRYIRTKSKREVEKIYSRTAKRIREKAISAKKSKSKTSKTS